MDRPVTTKRLPLKTLGIVAVLVVISATIGWYYFDQTSGRSLVIENNRLVITPVTEGLFEDFIPIRARVTPKKTVYLDVIEGGQVKERLIEDGATVKTGDLIVVLNNTSLQLEFARNEALVTEQLNNMRTIELQLEQNRLQHKRNLVEMDYQIKRLERQVQRLADLDDAGVAAKSQLEDAGDELAYYTNARDVTLESQATDARLQETQLTFLQTSAEQLQSNLAWRARISTHSTCELRWTASSRDSTSKSGRASNAAADSGRSTTPTVSSSRGIDEYYLGEWTSARRRSFEQDGTSYRPTVSKIYPQVDNGQFEVDLFSRQTSPAAFAAARLSRASLTLGDTTERYSSRTARSTRTPGGNWMFVVSGDGSQAVKRNVRLGRRNSRHIEVLDGLELARKSSQPLLELQGDGPSP